MFPLTRQRLTEVPGAHKGMQQMIVSFKIQTVTALYERRFRRSQAVQIKTLPGRFEDYAAISTKFLSSWRPTFWLFSGWNWVAKTFSLQIAEANVSP